MGTIYIYGHYIISRGLQPLIAHNVWSKKLQSEVCKLLLHLPTPLAIAKLLCANESGSSGRRKIIKSVNSVPYMQTSRFLKIGVKIKKADFDCSILSPVSRSFLLYPQRPSDSFRQARY